jgi:hypothetical protein
MRARIGAGVRACISCGYDITGRAMGARCPECGQASPAFELTGGLAAGGAISVRAAALTARVVAVLLAASTAMAVLVSVVEFGAATNALLSMAMVHARAASQFAGAVLCLLIARMLPRDSPWTRLLWITMIARASRGVLCELVGMGVFGSPSVGSLIELGEHQVPNVIDVLVAVAIMRIAPTGGLSSASRTPAAVAVGAAMLALLSSQSRVAIDPTGIAVGLIQSGVIAAIACAVALRRIAREIHAGSHE